MMRTLDWVDDAIELVDQTRLPWEEVMLTIDNVTELVAAITRLSVRGAPALGVAGAYGVVLAARACGSGDTVEAFEDSVATLRAARPTAVNLAVMVDRVAEVARSKGQEAALEEAHRIRDEELAASIAMGDVGADLVVELTGRTSVRALTICNTGGLATVERGTALAVIQTLHERGALLEAIPVETRPLLQGSRLTTWELERMGARYRLAVDSAGPFLLSRGAADVVLVGADRIARNGDTANKIGSFSLALGARHAGVPFIVVAPESTFDASTPDGQSIEVEYRSGGEVTGFAGARTSADGAEAVNPAFDITPAGLITAIVTDTRVIRP